MKLDDLNFTNVGLTVRKAEVERTSVLNKMNGMYDEHAKLVFLFDVSGSMAERVARTYSKQYLWPTEKMTEIRTKVAAAMAKYAAGMADDPFFNGLTYEEKEILKLIDKTRGLNGELLLTATDVELQERVVRHNLIGDLGINVDFSKEHVEPPTRIKLVKKLAVSELENRFKKFPNSRIAVIPFGDQPAVLFDDGTPDQLWPALEKLECGMHVPDPKKSPADPDYYYSGIRCGHGTDILAAIRKAMDVCREKPSVVGIHHFVIVSDGEDHCAADAILNWVPAMKASGIVLDYIHIGDGYLNDGLKRACLMLGGEAVTVNSEADFEKKFVAAVERKMLPCGS